MNCPKCGTANVAGATHCSSCGAALVATSEPSDSPGGNLFNTIVLFLVGLVAGGIAVLVLLSLEGWLLSHGGPNSNRYMGLLSVAEAVIVGAGAIMLLARARPPLPVTGLILGAAVALAGGLAVCGTLIYSG